MTIYSESIGNDWTIKFNEDTFKKEEHTLCQATHQWNTNPISGISARHKEKNTKYNSRFILRTIQVTNTQILN